MPDPPINPSTDQRLPTSHLAIWAFVTSLLLCCPLTGLVSVFLGFLAHRRIVAAEGRLGGRRLALAAIAIGTAGTVIWLFSWDAFGRWYLESIEDRIEATTRAVVNDAASGDLAAAGLAFDGAIVPTPEAFTAFGTAVDDRYGSLLGVSVESPRMTGTTMVPRMETRLLFEFERGGPRYGAAAYSLRATMLGQDVLPRPKILWIEIFDPTDGELRLGEPPEAEGGLNSAAVDPEAVEGDPDPENLETEPETETELEPEPDQDPTR